MFEKDTLFFSPQKALETALKNNEVETIPGHPIRALQICYYIGEQLINENIPKNCIHIDLENLYNYFVTTKNRFPQIYDLYSNDLNTDEAKILAKNIDDVLMVVKQERDKLVNLYVKQIIEQKPNFNDKKLRVFIPTIREATVIKHVSKNLSEAFEKAGYEVLFYLPDELGEQYPLAKYHYMYEFNPHIVVAIDFIENQVLNDNVFFFCWMQDPMPILYNGEPIKLRNRDYYFSLLNKFTKRLILKNVNESKIFFQPFATNTNIFYEDKKIIKKEKIVFLGSDYNFEKAFLVPKECINDIIEKIESNTLTKEITIKLALKYGFDLEIFEIQIVLSIIRRRIIEWLCTLKDIEIEVYGTELWKANHIIAPFYKGLLPYGESMAKIYNESKYAIAAHPFSRYQQRVIEISACGSIPIVYKGHLAQYEEDFKHEDNVLSFSTFKELQDCIGKTPKRDSRQISIDISYKEMVKKIIYIVKKAINE